MNYTAIKIKMLENGINQRKLAEILKVSETTLSLKMNNKRDFTVSELRSLMNLFNADANYFFS